MKDVTFGQYYPANSIVHRLNPAIKIVILIAYIVALFLVKKFAFYGLALCFGFLVVTVILAKIPPLKVLKSIKGVLFLVIFSAVLNIFFNREGTPLVEKWLGFITITDKGLIYAGFLTARLILLVFSASILTLTTTPVDLADGIETLMYPLKWIKFPVHEFALIMSIALRFIPTLMDETDRIIKAQKARGADFESGNIFKKAKALIPVLIPLLISSFRRADELGDAMDARCYAGSKKRTKYKRLTIGWFDVVSFILTGGLVAGVVLTNIYLGAII